MSNLSDVAAARGIGLHDGWTCAFNLNVVDGDLVGEKEALNKAIRGDIFQRALRD